MRKSTELNKEAMAILRRPRKDGVLGHPQFAEACDWAADVSICS